MPSELPYRSPFAPQLQPDGTYVAKTNEGVPFAYADVIEDPDPIIDWQAELGLPHDLEELAVLARPRGLSSRRLRAVCGDESVTRRSAGRPLRPQEWLYRFSGTPFSMEHLGLIIGVCYRMENFPNDPVVRSIMMDLPEAAGNFLVVEVQLYDSMLAEAAWLGIQRRRFTHVCPVLLRPLDAPPDSGELVEVCLTHRPVCPGARILKHWTEGS